MRRTRSPWVLPVPGAVLAAMLIASPALATTQGTWTPTGSMELARSFFTGTVLPNGNVLVSGGFSFPSGQVEFKSAEIQQAT